MVKVLRKWFMCLVCLLADTRGDGKSSTEVEVADDEAPEDQDDADVDSGNNDGKKRSDHIPRERFDKVNAKAQKLEKMVELGILSQGEDGEYRLNPAAIKQLTKTSEEKPDKTNEESLELTKADVDEASWPLVEKIQKRFTRQEKLFMDKSARDEFRLGQLYAENAILREYPEFLQKNSPLRVKALEIMKDDPEFREKYRGDPQAAFWAVKRASQLLEGKSQAVAKPKPKGFIIPKGDSGKTGVKKVDLSTLTNAQLDELEKKEHDRLQTLGQRK